MSKVVMLLVAVLTVSGGIFAWSVSREDSVEAVNLSGSSEDSGLAISDAQQQQRDQRRRTSMGLLQAAIGQYSANNNGRLPQDIQEVGTLIIDGNYLVEEEFLDPVKGVRYDKVSVGPGSFTYRTDFQCSGVDTATPGGGSRAFAIEFVMETGQGCMDSQ